VPRIEDVHLAVLAVAVAALLYFYFAACRSYARWQLRRRWSRATAAEERARELLEGLGYAVLGIQVETSYALVVDRDRKFVSVRADYLVSKGGLRYVAEVKSGKLAPSLDTATTRRQLLEYLVAFQANGVLLVDGETRCVHEVVFPTHATVLPPFTPRLTSSTGSRLAFSPRSHPCAALPSIAPFHFVRSRKRS